MQCANVHMLPLNEREHRVFEALGPLFEQERERMARIARYKNVATLKPHEFWARMRLVERLESPR